MLAEPLSLLLPCAWMTLRRHTLPARTGCQHGDGLAVGEPRALESGKSGRVRPSALSVPRAWGNEFPKASRTHARAGRLVLASHSVTLCDPARRVPALQWGQWADQDD